MRAAMITVRRTPPATRNKKVRISVKKEKKDIVQHDLNRAVRNPNVPVKMDTPQSEMIPQKTPSFMACIS